MGRPILSQKQINKYSIQRNTFIALFFVVFFCFCWVHLFVLQEQCLQEKITLFFVLFLFLFFCFLGLHPQHMEVPKLGVKSELQLPAYTTAIATWDLSCVCNLPHSSRQCQILNPLIKARDQTHNLMVPSRIVFRCAMTGTPLQ